MIENGLTEEEKYTIARREFARLLNGMRGLPLCYICKSKEKSVCSKMCEENFMLDKDALKRCGITVREGKEND